MAAKSDVSKVVLAYSGGLDTSVILKWLEVEYDCAPVVPGEKSEEGPEFRG